MLEAVWILVFPSLITQFPLLITQKWWDPWRCSLFRFVFKYCFHHLILTFLSNELTKLKQVLGVFELWKLSYDVIFVNIHTFRGLTVRGLSPQALLFTHTPPTALMSSNPFTPSSNRGPLHHHFSPFIVHHFSPFIFVLHPSTQSHQKIE